MWREYIKGNGEDDKKWFNNYMEEDILASVGEQTKGLQEIGFDDSLAVIYVGIGQESALIKIRDLGNNKVLISIHK